MASVTIGSYEGKPTIQFKSSDDDSFPLSFGPAKSRKMLAAIKEVGQEKFMEMLTKVANNK